MITPPSSNTMRFLLLNEVTVNDHSPDELCRLERQRGVGERPGGKARAKLVGGRGAAVQCGQVDNRLHRRATRKPPACRHMSPHVVTCHHMSPHGPSHDLEH
jgi:hypothetical protein